MLPHLDSGFAVDQAILSEEERVVVLRFGHDWDPVRCPSFLPAMSSPLGHQPPSILCLGVPFKWLGICLLATPHGHSGAVSLPRFIAGMHEDG